MEKMTKATELYDYLLANYDDLVFDDLQLCQPEESNNEVTNFNGKDYLKEQDYVCCEQKLIWWDKDGYLIVCLYNSHPNCKYETTEDVTEFLIGNNQAVKGCQFLDYPKDGSRISNSDTTKAYNDGLFCHFYEQMTANFNLIEFKKNAFIIGGEMGENNITFISSEKEEKLLYDEDFPFISSGKDAKLLSDEDLKTLKIKIYGKND
jgi:hypothetical protein